MRLINCSTLVIEEFIDKVPKYVILSHRWGKGEVSFADMMSGGSSYHQKEGYAKIVSTCQQARYDGFQYAWIDTCCIDKSSSSELSEAINSMFKWYEQAEMCYAYLSDVSKKHFETTFAKSEWFARGWTLQELLAPSVLSFFDQDWNSLGTKLDHASWICDITSISVLAFTPIDNSSAESRLNDFCVAQKFSWASRRYTTRQEDQAYCLMGIFQINMPLLYGEGSKAFTRLQEEIIRNYGDESIFAWGLDSMTSHPLGLSLDEMQHLRKGLFRYSSVLADSPKAFKNCADLDFVTSRIPFSMTNVGLQVRMPLSPALAQSSLDNWDFPEPSSKVWFGLLICYSGSDVELLGMLLEEVGQEVDSRKQMRRIAVIRDSAPIHTVVLGPRIIAQAESYSITIRQSQEMKFPRDWHQRPHLVVISESERFKKMGYDIGKVKWKPYGVMNTRASSQEWSQEAMLLQIVIPWGTIENGLLSLVFKTNQDVFNRTFTIFALGEKTTLPLKGSTFSYAEKVQIFDELSGTNRQQHDGRQHHRSGIDVTVGSVFDEFNVAVSCRRKENLRRWNVFELNIDALPP